MAQKYRDASEREIQFLLDSWRVWREVIREKFEGIREAPDISDGLISTSNINKAFPDSDSIHSISPNGDENQNKIESLWSMLRWQEDVDEVINNYRSASPSVTLEEMDTRNDESLTKTIQVMQEFVDNPSSWALISGGYGCGKTHILQAINCALWPMALYLTAGDFQQMVFEALERRELNKMTTNIKQAPILLYDDWGTEYKRMGEDNFVAAKFRQIIDYRYNIWQEFPTIVATNLTREEQQRRDGRVASRLRDVWKAEVLAIKADDYRASSVDS